MIHVPAHASRVRRPESVSRVRRARAMDWIETIKRAWVRSMGPVVGCVGKRIGQGRPIKGQACSSQEPTKKIVCRWKNALRRRATRLS